MFIFVLYSFSWDTEAVYAWSGDVDTMDMNLQIRMANKRKEEKVAHAAIFSFGLSIKTKFIKELDQWNLQRDARQRS